MLHALLQNPLCSLSLAAHQILCTAADGEDEGKQEPNWPSSTETDWAEAVAAAAAAQPAASSAAVQSGEQSWNWPWGSAQHALQGGFLDPEALLDDESEGKRQTHSWPCLL